MDFLIKALLVAGITYAVGYLIVETIALIDVSRNRKPSVGADAESAVGRTATVTRAFSPDTNGELRGRVRVDGEDWKAIYEGDATQPPAPGASVTVTAVDAARLTIRVG